MQVNWDRRVQALAQCEALVTGNAASFEAFTDLFRALLRDLISLQIADRCAAVGCRSWTPLDVMLDCSAVPLHGF